MRTTTSGITPITLRNATTGRARARSTSTPRHFFGFDLAQEALAPALLYPKGLNKISGHHAH